MKILGVVYDPTAGVTSECIVLQNQGSTSTDLSSWTLQDGANHVYSFPLGTSVQPNGVLRLWTRNGQNGGSDLYWNQGAPIWNVASGDVARLRDAGGVEVDAHPYAASAVPLTPGVAVPLGPGGGGAMYAPVISPHDANLFYVGCDMGGLYRSDNGGANWQMIDGRQMQVNANLTRVTAPRPIACHPDPAKRDWVLAWGEFRGLRLSRDRGATWTEIPTTSPAVPWASTTVRCFAIDPSNARLFVGTTDGAYFHDPDATGNWSGQNWVTCAGVAGEVVAFVLLGANAGQASHLLATRAAVVRSTDGGATWSDASGTPPNTVGGARLISDFAGGINPVLAPQPIIYVTLPSDANGQGGVYRSSDAGATWASLGGNPGLPRTVGAGEAVQYERVGVSSNNPNLVYVTAFAGSVSWPDATEIFRSLDGGNNWTGIWTAGNLSGGWMEYDRPNFGGPAFGLAVHQHAPGVLGPGNRLSLIWTNFGSLFLARDDGTAPVTWEGRYSSGATRAPDQAWSSIGLEVTTAWHYYKDPHDLQLPRSQQHHYICYTDIGFFRSLNDARGAGGGATWRNDATLPASVSHWQSNFYELAFDPSVPGTMWAAASDHHDLPYDKELSKPNSRPIPTGSGGVLLSSDYGATWQLCNGNLPNAAPESANPTPTLPGPALSIVLDPQSPVGSRRLWVSIFKQGVFRSDDGGANWSPALAGLPAPLHTYRLHLHDDGTLFCSVFGDRLNNYPLQSALFRSTDQGTSWQRVSDWHRYVTDYAVHPVDSQIIHLCTTGVQGTDGAVYRTVDGGQTWPAPTLGLAQALPDKPDDRFHAFAPYLHPLDPNIVFVATNTHGIWLSRDAGSTWAKFNAIPFVRVQRFTIDPQDPNRIFIATHGGGLFEVALS